MFDLRGALLKKAEMESARLADFDFRLRARTMAALAQEIGGDRSALVGLIAEKNDPAILDQLSAETGRPLSEISDAYAKARAITERQLIEEFGDPTPHRLA